MGITAILQSNVISNVSFLYSHSSALAEVVQGFFPLLESVIPEALPMFLMGSALARSRYVLEPAGIGSPGHGGWQLLTVATPATSSTPLSYPVATITLPCKPNTQEM